MSDLEKFAKRYSADVGQLRKWIIGMGIEASRDENGVGGEGVDSGQDLLPKGLLDLLVTGPGG